MDRALKILLIEDDPDISAVARFSLESLGGFEVWVSSSGSEGVERYGEVNPDVVLLDVMMPCMDGQETLRKLREAHPAGLAPVIFMTAKSLPEELSELTKLGVAGIIRKPFDPLTLHLKVEKISREAHGS